MITRTLMSIAIALALSGLCAAQTEPEPTEPEATESEQAEAEPTEETPQTPSAQEPAQEDEEDMPSLDELLGLDGEDEGEDPAEKELERALSGAEVGDAFVQAVGLMGDVADRIQTDHDTGIATQRLQEDILKRLDQLIASLEQMQQQSSSQSSSSQQQQQQQQPNQPQQQQQQRQEGSESTEHADAPELQEGQLRPNLEPVTASWGNLPSRVREMLLQGASDRFSAMYETMTEAYYKRLAEEGSSP